MDLTQSIFVSTAGLAAGVVNGAAGGGSLISFPVLLSLGYPALRANVTSTVGIWPGYLGGSAGFRREIGGQGDRMRFMALTTLGGSVAGAALLLTTPSSQFQHLAPYLILTACALFAIQPVLVRQIRSRRPDGHLHPAFLHMGIFCAALYGSYFGAGLGVLILAVLALTLPDQLVRLNGLRSVLSLAINTLAVAIFAVAAPVAWSAVALMGAASLAGGYIGANLARRIPASLFKTLVIALGLATAGRLLAG